MTRRRSPQPRRPGAGPTRTTGREKEQNKDSELRQARVQRKAESQQKQRLRRLDWDAETDDVADNLDGPRDLEADDFTLGDDSDADDEEDRE